MSNRTGIVTSKFTGKGVQLLNGKWWWLDFPFPRPTIYYFIIDGTRQLQVSEETYNETQIGDSMSYEIPNQISFERELVIVAIILIISYCLGYILLFIR